MKFFVVYRDGVMRFLLQVFLHKSLFRWEKCLNRRFFVLGLLLGSNPHLKIDFLLGVQFKVQAI